MLLQSSPPPATTRAIYHPTRQLFNMFNHYGIYVLCVITSRALLEASDKVFLVIRERFMKIVLLCTLRRHFPHVLCNDVVGHQQLGTQRPSGIFCLPVEHASGEDFSLGWVAQRHETRNWIHVASAATATYTRVGKVQLYHITSAPFQYVTHSKVVIPYRRFGTTCLS